VSPPSFVSAEDHDANRINDHSGTMTATENSAMDLLDSRRSGRKDDDFPHPSQARVNSPHPGAISSDVSQSQKRLTMVSGEHL
jgi:hypothetical protein